MTKASQKIVYCLYRQEAKIQLNGFYQNYHKIKRFSKSSIWAEMSVLSVCQLFGLFGGKTKCQILTSSVGKVLR